MIVKDETAFQKGVKRHGFRDPRVCNKNIECQTACGQFLRQRHRGTAVARPENRRMTVRSS